ncbi:MAG: hypothetical protein AWU58_531 [Methanohalophilus sp. T328-1]|jgi:GNAT superfamily N-acetyltransferase|uniref:Acetyltransferase (GNAT) family protein n=3 Tax=Methanohalophilus euhalobius TaxID=51203 RepID=A0A285GHZ5_9EURY|nr:MULTISPECIES: GNAT family N-acetyltransferase [Methanohalophilus]KXS46457.1 MAG: hypothetical protein AWU58_531 [Methanohalophilus sp. T328-1]RSD34321.1 MAG: hypothetical protein CI953_943 [Methanohalophilus sp.]OBZ35021.1 MAG: hypothetical protein A9957_09005 [Methanohalophilus sp. DAL1]RSD35944.1 MAG: hypothetical protein CI952_624 [Methanohalophilus sp.]TCL10934.1 hypothetical protein C7960_0023 [Methanohalophilus euhalobius]
MHLAKDRDIGRVACCKEAIDASWAIYDSFSLLDYFHDCEFAMQSRRFSWGGAVAYAYDARDAIYILLLFSRQQNRGHGHRLVNCIIEHARYKGYSRVYVTTSYRSPHHYAAGRFYVSCGFRMIGSDEEHMYYGLDVNDVPVFHCPDTSTPSANFEYRLSDFLLIGMALMLDTLNRDRGEPKVVQKLGKVIGEKEKRFFK